MSALNRNDPEPDGSNARNVCAGQKDAAAIVAKMLGNSALPASVSHSSTTVHLPTTSPPHGCTLPQLAPPSEPPPQPRTNAALARHANATRLNSTRPPPDVGRNSLKRVDRSRR